MEKRYNEDGMRLTDCCGAVSTHDENGELYCKACYNVVSPGEGDGSEYANDEASPAFIAGMNRRVGAEV